MDLKQAFFPAETQRAPEVIYDQIYQQIANGRLKPGDLLPSERVLAEQFQRSRHVIREALRMLQQDGLITVEVGSAGGSIVQQVSADLLGTPLKHYLADGGTVFPAPAVRGANVLSEAERMASAMKFQKSACIEPMYAELPFLDRFQAAKDDGFDFVEFWSWTDKDLGAVRDAAERAGIGIAGFNGDAELSLIDPAQRADYLAFLEQSIAAARQVGARSLTIHSNGLGEGGRVLNAYEDLSDTVKLCAMYGTLQACAALAEKNGILLNLEPLNITTDHPGNFLRTTRMAAELTRLIGSPMLKVLYDVYHMQLNEGSLCDNIRAYGSQFGHIHIADAPGRHEPGTGEICYPRVLACLEEIGYTGLVGFELIPKTTTAEAVKAILRL